MIKCNSINSMFYLSIFFGQKQFEAKHSCHAIRINTPTKRHQQPFCLNEKSHIHKIKSKYRFFVCEHKGITALAFIKNFGVK